MDEFNTPGEREYYDEHDFSQGGANNEYADMNSQLEAINGQRSDLPPFNFFGLNTDADPMTSLQNYNNMDQGNPLGSIRRTVSPEALPNTSSTLSALPHVQTHSTGARYPVRAHEGAIDPRILGVQHQPSYGNVTSSYPIVSGYPKSPYNQNGYAAGPQSFAEKLINPNSEQAKLLEREVFRLRQELDITQNELAITQEELRLERETRTQEQTLIVPRSKPGRKPKENGPPKDGDAKNSRPANIANFNAEAFYGEIPVVPREWTGQQTGKDFSYTEYGELDPNVKFTIPELWDFLMTHPQDHPIAGARPVLWIQNTPADSGNRYPAKMSSTCRFNDCPVEKGTIKKGEYRVAIDEWAYNEPESYDKDPYHNAGYVHLYCLEKYFDFAHLARHVSIGPDVRQLKEGRNKMAITRDYSTMEAICENFKKNTVSWTHPRPDDWFESSLTLALTEEHLSKQPATRQKVRGDREGNSIDVHRNNLDVMVLNRKTRKARGSGGPKRTYNKRATTRGKKRKAAEYDSDSDSNDSDAGSVLDSNPFGSDYAGPSTQTRGQTAKKQKTNTPAAESWQVGQANKTLNTHFDDYTKPWMR